MVLVGLETLELRAALERERLVRAALDRRLAETAHDLRAALASIIGYAQMLADPRQEALGTREVAGRISRLALGVCEITSELLARGNPLQAPRRGNRRFAVREVLATCADGVEPLCREKGLRLRTDFPAKVRFDGDASVVTRIVSNLLSNAVRYTESGEIRVSAHLSPGGLLIEVADTGIGIAEADRERIFEEFCRLEEGRRMVPLGTGLGLASVRRLCDRLGATIAVDSAVGTGSVFRVRLPQRRRRRAAHAPQASLFAQP